MAFPLGIAGSEATPAKGGMGVHMPTLRDAESRHRNPGVAPVHGLNARIGIARSGGRGATARHPATYGSDGAHIGMAFSCTCTRSDVHARIGIDSPRFGARDPPRGWPARCHVAKASIVVPGARIGARFLSATIRLRQTSRQFVDHAGRAVPRLSAG